MYFSTIKCDDALYEEAKSFFLAQWRSDLLYREPSSLIGAYLVTQWMLKLWKSWFSFITGVYSYEDMYFSVSHSEDMIAVIIDSQKVAVDVEYIRPRDESLLHNVNIIDTSLSPRENFYLQWCAKECLVKYLDLTSSEIGGMTVKSFSSNQHFSLNESEFNSSITLLYMWKEYQIHANIQNGVVLAVLC